MREGLVLLTYKNANVNELNFLKTSLYLLNLITHLGLVNLKYKMTNMSKCN